jgi:ATP-dependent protease ClpP protease subunit
MAQTPINFTHAMIYAGPLNPPQTNILRNQLAFLNQPQQPPGITHLPCKGLLIIFSSTGGNTFEMRSLYDLIRCLPYPIEIHATGVIKSAAVFLMLAADRRTAAPNTTFLFHPWTWGTDLHPGHTAEGLQVLPMQLKDEIDWAKEILNERSKLTYDKISALELFKTPRIEEMDFALEYGLIHEEVERKIPPEIMTWNIA